MSTRTRRALFVFALIFAAAGLIAWGFALYLTSFALTLPSSYSQSKSTLALAFVLQGASLFAFASSFWFVLIFGPKESKVHPQCPKCSYSLEGHALGTCPECGERWTAGHIMRAP